MPVISLVTEVIENVSRLYSTRSLTKNEKSNLKILPEDGEKLEIECTTTNLDLRMSKLSSLIIKFRPTTVGETASIIYHNPLSLTVRRDTALS